MIAIGTAGKITTQDSVLNLSKCLYQHYTASFWEPGTGTRIFSQLLRKGGTVSTSETLGHRISWETPNLGNHFIHPSAVLIWFVYIYLYFRGSWDRKNRDKKSCLDHKTPWNISEALKREIYVIWNWAKTKPHFFIYLLVREFPEVSLWSFLHTNYTRA